MDGMEEAGDQAAMEHSETQKLVTKFGRTISNPQSAPIVALESAIND
jgi:hypothetical protein